VGWDTDIDLHSMIIDAKHRYSLDFIMEIIITGYWAIWDHRNDYIFNQQNPSLVTCMIKFKIYCAVILHRARPSLKEGMRAWLDTL
jgi:hypothetical protein